MTIRPLALGAALFACAGAVPAAGAGAHPGIPNGVRFVARVSNPWFPLLPGSRWIYTGVKDGKRSRDVVTVVRRAQTIDGVKVTVVHDRLYLAGRLEERTTDYYAQDLDIRLGKENIAANARSGMRCGSPDATTRSTLRIPAAVTTRNSCNGAGSRLRTCRS